MSKYTVGPWDVVVSSYKPYNFLIKPVPGQVVAEIDNLESAEETYANARLIAAAPELLEALEALVSYTTACEGLLNSTCAGQVITAKEVINNVIEEP